MFRWQPPAPKASIDKRPTKQQLQGKMEEQKPFRNKDGPVITREDIASHFLTKAERS